ncbi:uncharacterized protein G2W53_012196 [Senna tora]|uniref:Uncharacterized protein n=1 Tax=Senna tora TaxID=362788 RepID=A0A834WQH1_9FABA|nr:uncharacterized protein G2W53_012196 [Senna tora]
MGSMKRIMKPIRSTASLRLAIPPSGTFQNAKPVFVLHSSLSS